jgi:hypothetical protein
VERGPQVFESSKTWLSAKVSPPAFEPNAQLGPDQFDHFLDQNPISRELYKQFQSPTHQFVSDLFRPFDVNVEFLDSRHGQASKTED